MKNGKKNFIFIFLSVILFLSGCTTSDTKDSIDLKVFKTGDIYCYEGLEWGISKEEFEAKKGILLKEYHSTIPTRFIADSEFTLWDSKGIQTFEFIENKFTSVSYDFFEDDNDLHDLSKKLLSELESIYGKCDDELEMKMWSGKGYRWMNYNEDNSRTTLQLHCTGDEKKMTHITLTVAYMDPAPEEE